MDTIFHVQSLGLVIKTNQIITKFLQYFLGDAEILNFDGDGLLYRSLVQLGFIVAYVQFFCLIHTDQPPVARHSMDRISWE